MNTVLPSILGTHQAAKQAETIRLKTEEQQLLETRETALRILFTGTDFFYGSLASAAPTTYTRAAAGGLGITRMLHGLISTGAAQVEHDILEEAVPWQAYVKHGADGVAGFGLILSAAGAGAIGMSMTALGDLVGIYAQYKMTK
ncbi:MAG: hypothetical protein HYU64_21645 [Armatimonadetes bacterium]|nr:hypothetical protein [Armatimonadota bacterium]